MGFDKLLRSLEDQAKSHRDAIAGDSAAEVDAIWRRVRDTAAQQRSAALSDYLEQRDQRVQLELANRRLRARALELRAQDELLSAVRAQALAAAGNLGVDRWSAVAERLLDDALEFLPADVRVRVSPDVKAALEPIAKRRSLPLEVDPELPTGFVAESEDSSVRVDQTFAARLDALWPQLAVELVAKVEEVH